jgi:acetyl-CoA carboxylase carboxyl transferase subunit beta
VKNLKELIRRSESPEAEPEPAREACLSCGADLVGSRSYERYRVCHSCGFHFHLGGRERTALLLDPGSFRESDRGVTNIDPISFSTERQPYRTRVIRAQRRTGLTESVLTGTGTVFGREVVVAVLDFSFLGGSIGVAAGERLARAFEKATSRDVPIITVCSTSGTRMQEGVLALMQVPRVMAAALRHSERGLPHIAILTDPTTGSAYSGFVNLADYIMAEPNALVGYAALAVLEEQAQDGLPKASHTSERHLELGLIDAVVPREQLRDSVGFLLDMLRADLQLSASPSWRERPVQHTPHAALQQVQLSRHSNRPSASDFIARMAPLFIALRGDRTGQDDSSIIAGIASPGGEPVVFIGQERRHGDPRSGWIGPAGFRKATRAMRLAAKFGLPVVTLVDTAGANPGIESEEAGLGPALAECLATMLELPVPTVAVITGEGSSEAAVALAAADRVLMLDNAVYEVIKPEDAARNFLEIETPGEVADRLRITSHDCLRLGIADGLVPEPGEGAHSNADEAAAILRRAILRELVRVQEMNPQRRLSRRHDRYRHTGSTRARMRGTLERRLAHIADRIGATVDRIRRRNARRRMEPGESSEIPV